MKNSLLKLLVLISLFVIDFKAYATCTLPIPSNVKLKNQTSCSVDVSWDKVTNAAYYIVQYRVTGSGTWFYTTNITDKTTTLTGLLANTSYDAAVASYCNDNTTAGFSAAVLKTTKKCSTPSNLSSTNVTISSVTINWTAVCGSNLFILQYRKVGVTTWTKISNITTTNYTLIDLLNTTKYEYRVQADCGSAKSSWSGILNFTTLTPNGTKGNILLIMLDDARFDEFQSNGAPVWFTTPAITSIANEGVNFKITIPTTSQCAPSRACIYTGLYPHLNGVTKNGDQLDSSLNMIQKILKMKGYYTGFVGKYGQFLGTPTGFNWWATSDGDLYNNALYTINGVDTTISGSIIDIYPQLAKTFLNSVPEGKNFVLFYFPRAPHLPTIPRTVDSLLYIGESVPYPSNHKFYTNNYPSFYTDHKWYADSLSIDSLKRLRFQTIKGTDDNVDSLLNWLKEKGSLDSTLVAFTSDNGYLLGEHKLNEKILALEESIRLPLFIRYPKWFSSGSIITDEIASNLDFATTFLDFAGIENTFGFQGLSLHKIYSGETYRKNFLYESGYDPNTAKLRAVRTLNDIFIRSYCKTTCEEYYDLVVDPKEDSNLIFKTEYQAIIASEKILLDSLRTSFNDITPTKKTCNLVSDFMRDYFIDNDIDLPNELAVIPTLATQSFHIYFENTKKLPAQLKVFDMLGKEIENENMGIEYFYSQPDCGKWNNGIYNIVVNQGGKVYSQMIVVNH